MFPELIDPASLAVDIDAEGRANLSADRLRYVLSLAGVNLDPLVLEQVAAAHGAALPPFAIRMGDWELDLPVAAARAVVNGVVLTSVLAAQDQASIPATVLSVVVPLIFNVERVRLRASDRAVYAELLHHAPDRKGIEDWHRSLPERVREEVSVLEFRNVIERLEDAGLAEWDEFGVVTIDPPGRRRLVRLALPPSTR